MYKQKLEAAKKLFSILLCIDIAITVIVLISNFWTYSVIEDIRNGSTTDIPTFVSTKSFWDNFSMLLFLTTTGVGIGLVMWLSACYKYAKNDLGVVGFKNENWAVYGWIIPVINLFKPYQAINELYKAGGVNWQKSEDWKKESWSGLLISWWIFYALTHFVMSIAFKQIYKIMERSQASVENEVFVLGVSSTFCAVSLIIAGLWFFVAGNLTRRLFERNLVQITASSPKAVDVYPINSSRAMPSPTIAPTSNFNQSAASSQPLQATFEDSYGAAYPNYPGNSPIAMPSPASAPASNFNQPAPSSQPVRANFAASAATTSSVSDDLWAQALTEYDSGCRNQGLWARLFSEAQGNEAAVKANYMRIRVSEMQQVIAIDKEHVESAQKVAAAAAKEAELLEAMNAEQRAHDALPKGLCPNCWSTILSIDANHCPKCLAYFGRASKLKIKPLSKSEQIAELRDISLNRGKLTEYEAELLKRGQ